MAGGVTTVEIKSGYGLDTAKRNAPAQRRQRALGKSEPVRVVATLLALHALPPEFADRRDDYVTMVVDEMIPAIAKARLATSVDAYCDTIAFTPREVERLFRAASEHGLRVKLHAEQLSNQSGAELAAQYRALSADHLEHLDDAGAKAMAEAGTVAVLLPGAFYALQETRKPPVQLLRDHRRPHRHRHRLQPRHLAFAVADAGDEHGVHFVRPDARGSAGRHDHQRRARARPRTRTSAPSRPARPPTSPCGALESLAELGYWIGLPGPGTPHFRRTGRLTDQRRDNSRHIRARRGLEIVAKSWATEAAVRMLMNNLDDEVAEDPQSLVVYGGIGRAARNWACFDTIVETLERLGDDETLLVQSGKPVGVFRTHRDAPARADRQLQPRAQMGDLGEVQRARSRRA